MQGIFERSNNLGWVRVFEMCINLTKTLIQHAHAKEQSSPASSPQQNRPYLPTIFTVSILHQFKTRQHLTVRKKPTEKPTRIVANDFFQSYSFLCPVFPCSTFNSSNNSNIIGWDIFIFFKKRRFPAWQLLTSFRLATKSREENFRSLSTFFLLLPVKECWSNRMLEQPLTEEARGWTRHV